MSKNKMTAEEQGSLPGIADANAAAVRHLQTLLADGKFSRQIPKVVAADAKKTAEERVNMVDQPADNCNNSTYVVLRTDAIRIAEAHAADAVAEVRTRAEKAEAAVRAGDALLASWEHEVVQLRRQVDAWEQQSYAAHKRAEKAEARVDELEAEVAPLRLAVQRVRGLLQRGLDLNIVEANGGGVDEWEGDVTAALGLQAPKEVQL